MTSGLSEIPILDFHEVATSHRSVATLSNSTGRVAHIARPPGSHYRARTYAPGRYTPPLERPVSSNRRESCRVYPSDIRRHGIYTQDRWWHPDAGAANRPGPAHRGGLPHLV